MPDLPSITDHMLRGLFTVAVCILLVSCAKPPHQEMDAAEYMVKRARELQAVDFAPVEYEAARRALIDARMAMEKADYADARDSIDYALLHARRAVSLAEQGRARLEQEETEKALLAEQARQAVQIKAQTEKVGIKQEKKQPAAKPMPDPAPPPHRRRALNRSMYTLLVKGKPSGQFRHNLRSTVKACCGPCSTRPIATRSRTRARYSPVKPSTSVAT